MDIRSSLPTLDKDDSRLRLKVENRMRNIFVTQVEDAREDEDNVNHIPVITETSKILETGVNTLQRTRLLKKQVQMDEMDRLLALKRHEFKCHMQGLAERRARLEQKQQETRERADKFEKFVEDNEVKRRRALKKYQLAKQQNRLKEVEKEELAEQLERLQTRQQYLKDRVTEYKMYEDYLIKTVDFLPENYLDYGSDSQVMPIIRRHETLSLTHQDLVERLGQLVEELEESHRHLEALKQEHNSNKLMANRTLSELQSQWDSMKEQNKQKEMNLLIHHGQSRNKLEEEGCLLIAVRNLGEQCYLQNYGPLEEMDMLTILDMVKEFILEKADIEKRAARLTESGSAMTSAMDRASGSLKNNSKTHMKTQLKSATNADGYRRRNNPIDCWIPRLCLSAMADIRPLVNQKEEFSGLLDPDARYKEICSQFEFVRKIQGDGNCFYRAVCFGHLESVLENSKTLQRFKDTLLLSERELLTAGFDESSFKDLLNVFLDVLGQCEAECQEATLLRLFNEKSTSNSVVQYLRLLTSAYLQNHADFFSHFVEAPNLKVYCKQEVETMAMECDHVDILALSEALGVGIHIVSMERGDKQQLVHHTIPEGAKPSLHLLYKASHYDILYPHLSH